MANSIHNPDTKWFSNESGESPAIVMGLDLADLNTVDLSLDQVIAQFRNQRRWQFWKRSDSRQ